MIADIATGNHAWGDVLFLVAFILAVVAALFTARPIGDGRVSALGWLSIASLALALLVL
jgi:Co/Zn/Cd efflux system component